MRCGSLQGRSVVLVMCMAQPGSLVTHAATRLMFADLLASSLSWCEILRRSSIMSPSP